MSDCMFVKRLVEEGIQSPIEQFFTSVEQACEEARQWIQEEVEQWVQRFEQQTQRICQSWPWPFNWLCHAVTTLVLVVMKVTVLVTKLVVYTVCKTVTIVTRVVVTVIVRVLKYVLILVCALGKGEWAEAGQALGGLWTSLVDAVEDITRDSIRLIADIVKDVLVAAIDIVGNLAAAALSFICTFPAFRPQEQGACLQRVKDVFSGLTKLVVGVIDAVASIADGVALLGSGIFRFFDMQKISEGLVKIVFGGTFSVWHSIRAGTGLFVADGFREVAQTGELMVCIESLIKELVPAERREQMRRAIGLDVGVVRLRWPVTITRFYLESDAKNAAVNPQSLHPTFINLYDLAAGFNVQWPPPWSRPRNEMVIAGTRQRPTRDDIDRYLAQKPLPDTALFDARESSRFRIYPMARDVLDLHIATAVEKAKEIGLHLVFAVDEKPATQWFDARVSTVPNPQLGSGLDRLLEESLGRTKMPTQRCPVAVGALVRDDPVLDPGIFGATNFSPPEALSGLEYRDAWPDYVFRYVLIHEIGHYFGLEHDGHTGANHIMWSLGSGIAPVSWETVGEAFLSAQPRFTGNDACTVWRWILTNAQQCIALPPPRPPSG